jgi:hypothetical protein
VKLSQPLNQCNSSSMDPPVSATWKIVEPPESRFCLPLSLLQFSQFRPLHLQTLKLCLQNFPLFSAQVMWFPALLTGLSTTFTQVDTPPPPPSLPKPATWNRTYLGLPKQTSDVWNPVALFAVPHPLGITIAYGTKKRMGHGTHTLAFSLPSKHNLGSICLSSASEVAKLASHRHGGPPPHQAGLVQRPAGVHAFLATPGQIEYIPGNRFYPILRGFWHAPGQPLLHSLF